MERELASYTEKRNGIATASVRAGVTRDLVLWDRGRLERNGIYAELRGIVDFATTPKHVTETRWFGMGMSVRGYVSRTPALLHASTEATTASGEPRTSRRDYGFLVCWEWIASR